MTSKKGVSVRFQKGYGHPIRASFDVDRRSFIRRSSFLGCTLLLDRFALPENDTNSFSPAAMWRLDEGNGNKTKEAVSGLLDVISNRANSPEWTCVGPGSRSALRFDGYSTWITHSAASAPPLMDAFSLEVRLAIKSYPVSDAAFVNQRRYPDAGYFFGLTKFGLWGLSLALALPHGVEWYECWTSEPAPIARWLHLAATFHKQRGVALYLDGKEIRTEPGRSGFMEPTTSVDLLIGRDNDSPVVDGIFPTGMFNGLIDEVRIYKKALSKAEIAHRFNSNAAGCEPDLSVPSRRFEVDPHRPQFHAIPPAAWTNEPHGLIHWKGKYHLFYQKNSNGPYWGQIQWGHMASPDLIHWEHLPVALAPEPGPDQQGCWSGSTIIARGVPTIVYTGADGKKASISIATNSGDMKEWKKYAGNPVIGSPPASLHAKEFRDPFVWSEGDTFYMIIGSGITDTGGTALLYKSPDMIHWEFLKPLLVGDKSNSGVFWEMPVFGRLGDKYLLMVTEVPARDSYWIGTWSDETFVPDTLMPRRLDLINHYLSPAIALDEQSRLIAIGIIPETRSREEVFAAGWAHVYGLPRVMSLSPHGQLKQQPIPELQVLRAGIKRYRNIDIQSDSPNALPGLQGDCLEIIATFTQWNARRFGLSLRRSPAGEEETRIYFETSSQILYFDRTRSSLNTAVQRNLLSGQLQLSMNESLVLHIFLDRSVIEVFINEHAVFASRIYPTRRDSIGVTAFAEGGEVRLESLDAWNMRSTLL